MYKDIVDIIKNTCLRHKGVRTFKYQSDTLNNSQNNSAPFQCYLDDVSLSELNITTNIFKVSFELYILGQANVSEERTILDVQNYAYTVACNILAYIDNNREWSNVISVYDYSILTLSHYTSDDSCGVKLSITIQTPNPVNMCELDSNFNDEPYEEKEDKEITIDKDEVGRIDLKPIKLRPNC